MSEEQLENGTEQDVKPVKLSIGATVALVIGVIVLLFIIVITFRGCSVQKTVNSGGKPQTTETSVTEPPETTTNMLTEPTIFVENEADFGGSVTAPTENSTSGNKPSSTEGEFGMIVDNGFSEVADPVLSEVRQAFGMVIGKSIYKKDGAYVYGVSVSIVINEQSVSAQYFCPRKTFENLRSGDSLSVSYQVDSSGAVSIYSISKG